MASPPSAGNPSLTALSHGYITGVTNNGSSGFPRMEIDKFCQDKVRLNLFLLAMQDIQQNTNFYTDKWCWFQIQGIHGAPDIPWDGIGPDAYYKWLTANGLASEAHNYTIDYLNSRGVTASELANLTAPAVVAKLGPPPTTGDTNFGFCTHGSVLFPTWHRVYMAMLEQSVQARMVTIADTFPAGTDIRRLSRTAAQQFRFPYWDYFQPRASDPSTNAPISGLSMIFAVEKVQVRLPASPTVLTTISNPLYSYSFPGKSAILAAVPSTEQDGVFWANFDISSTVTFRHANISATNPTPGVKAGDSDNVDLQRTFLSQVTALQQKVYQSLTTDQGYRKFANNFWKLSEELSSGNATSLNSTTISGNAISLEGWHNTMHGVIGGALTVGGQMADPTYAAFDPIFPFHHGMVDRIFALWQALWPQYWWTSGTSAAQENNYTTITGTLEDSQAALLPFRKRIDFPIGASLFISTFWRSDDVRDWTNLGYQYDDLPIASPPLDFTNPTSPALTALKTAATNEATARYQWFGTVPAPTYAAQLAPSPMTNANVEAFLNPIYYDGRTVPVALYPPPSSTATNRMVIHPPKGKQKQTQEQAAVEEKATQSRPDVRKEKSQVNGVKPKKPAQPVPFTYIFPQALIDSQNRIPEWTFNFRCLRHALQTSFTVYVFLGDFPSDSTLWNHSPSLVLPLLQLVQHNPHAFEPNGAGPGGSYESMARKLIPKDKTHITKEHRCPNCRAQERIGGLIADWAPLTVALLNAYKSGEQLPPEDEIPEGDPPGLVLKSLGPDDVIPFLQRNLHWRVLRSDGEEIRTDSIPAFKVFVTEQMMTLPRHTGELPKYDQTTMHWDVTHGRAGGLHRGKMP